MLLVRARLNHKLCLKKECPILDKLLYILQLQALMNFFIPMRGCLTCLWYLGTVDYLRKMKIMAYSSVCHVHHLKDE